MIRLIGPGFSLAWRNHDAERLSAFWQRDGDMFHPDGFMEGSQEIIRQNRAHLFMREEYRGSRHGLMIGNIRCITPDVAVADAKWDLRGVTGPKGGVLPPIEGLSTLVLKRNGSVWLIAAYRYSIKQDAGQPVLLKRPGAPETIR